jgi:5'-3' exonuclease
MQIVGIDVSYLCIRNLYIGKREVGSFSAQRAVLATLHEFQALERSFMPDRMVFCFEHPHLYRKDWFPEYKQKRHQKELPPEEKEALRDLYREIDNLLFTYLPKIGYKNLAYVDGFESDDALAYLASIVTHDDRLVIVSDDADLFQCLTPEVSMYSPRLRRMRGARWFRKEFGFEPPEWATVKELFGCPSDNVPGIPGIGKQTALKFVRGQLPEGHRALEIIHGAQEIRKRNRMLTALPMPNPPVPFPRLRLEEDDISLSGWTEVVRHLRKNERCPV